MTVHNEAVLGNEKNFTVFQFGRHIIRFRAPYSLERYTKVKEWNKGYLVVMAKYEHNDKAIIFLKDKIYSKIITKSKILANYI